ncbi:response regulator [Pedobacter alpinus]|uniref:response regulator n=1 Tax=Pedobacter alpinus TaxID=1590643 RepID=UPI00366A6E67
MLIKIKGFILLILFVIILLEIETKAIENPSVISLGIEKGLSKNSVRCIYKDKKGFMWFGTHDGLNHFDHSGIVNYDSIVGQGTDFKISLPKGKGHYGDQFIYEEENRPMLIPELIEDDGTIDVLNLMEEHEIEESKQAIELDPTTEKNAILIVEDHPEIRNYIKQIFKSAYLIYEAEDGSHGYELAKKNVPDIVIIDLIMKELNGVGLCIKIKSNLELSHIPVILLTSSSSSEIKLKGIEQGADDFITKPFDRHILIARVVNLLKSRSTLQRYFFKETTLKSEDFKVSTAYKEFLEKCISITEKHIQDPDFNVKILANELATAPSLLYRKVKSISGKVQMNLLGT